MNEGEMWTTALNKAVNNLAARGQKMDQQSIAEEAAVLVDIMKRKQPVQQQRSVQTPRGKPAIPEQAMQEAVQQEQAAVPEKSVQLQQDTGPRDLSSIIKAAVASVAGGAAAGYAANKLLPRGSKVNERVAPTVDQTSPRQPDIRDAEIVPDQQIQADKRPMLNAASEVNLPATTGKPLTIEDILATLADNGRAPVDLQDTRMLPAATKPNLPAVTEQPATIEQILMKAIGNKEPAKKVASKAVKKTAKAATGAAKAAKETAKKVIRKVIR